MNKQAAVLNRRSEEREPYDTEAEFYLESSVFKAKLVDISDSGVRFAMPKPVNVHIRFKIGEKRISRMAQLVWCGKNADEGLDYGFNFIMDE